MWVGCDLKTIAIGNVSQMPALQDADVSTMDAQQVDDLPNLVNTFTYISPEPEDRSAGGEAFGRGWQMIIKPIHICA
jgi:hypothetical protein